MDTAAGLQDSSERMLIKEPDSINWHGHQPDASFLGIQQPLQNSSIDFAGLTLSASQGLGGLTQNASKEHDRQRACEPIIRETIETAANVSPLQLMQENLIFGTMGHQGLQPMGVATAD